VTTTSIREADKKVHPVDTQWHFPIMARYGFQPLTLEAVGLVRSYDYISGDGLGLKIRVSTGFSSDYWRDETNNAGGYWSALEPHLRKLTSPTEGD
jgi:hypothetical protein